MSLSSVELDRSFSAMMARAEESLRKKDLRRALLRIKCALRLFRLWGAAARRELVEPKRLDSLIPSNQFLPSDPGFSR